MSKTIRYTEGMDVRRARRIARNARRARIYRNEEER